MGAGKSADGRAVLVAGVVAGVAATLAQILLWLAAGENVWALLLRDAALTAALVLGQAVRTTPATFDAGIMLAATGIHFALSVIYAAVLLPVAKQLALIPSLLAAPVLVLCCISSICMALPSCSPGLSRRVAGSRWRHILSSASL